MGERPRWFRQTHTENDPLGGRPVVAFPAMVTKTEVWVENSIGVVVRTRFRHDGDWWLDAGPDSRRLTASSALAGYRRIKTADEGNADS